MNSQGNIDPKLYNIFLKVQYEFGRKLKIKSADRNPEENRNTGGSRNSAHLTGKAIDIKLDVPSRPDIKKLISLGSKHGVLGIGVYRDAEDIHYDIDETKGLRAWGPDYSRRSIPSWASPEIDDHLAKKKTKLQESIDRMKDMMGVEKKRIHLDMQDLLNRGIIYITQAHDLTTGERIPPTEDPNTGEMFDDSTNLITKYNIQYPEKGTQDFIYKALEHPRPDMVNWWQEHQDQLSDHKYQQILKSMNL